MLKISVVTVCYNAAVSIEQTMLSVLGQSYPDIEYIVIDGGSTDGTVDIIKKYADRLAYWVSEPDKGIYDAMNKGIAAATGSYINFMNSGDSFYDNRVVEAVVPYLSSDMKAVIYGNAAICNGEKYIIKKPIPIEKINQQFLNEGKNYVLVGPGRWGSSDTWLGIPVKWPHISAARVIVEAGLTNYRVDPSQGTHFFQNLTSFGVGYFTINAFMNDGVYNQEFLNAQPAVEETKYLRHVRFEKPMIVKMDGKKKLGVVLMPGIDK